MAGSPHQTRILAGAAALIALLAVACWAVVHHPVPAEVSPPEPWSIQGTRMVLPIQVIPLDFMDYGDGGLLFGVQDGAGNKRLIRCEYGRDDAPYEHLSFLPTLPSLIATTLPTMVPLGPDEVLVRNVIYHVLEREGYPGGAHGRGWAHMAQLLYPSLLDRLFFRLQGRNSGAD